MALPIRARLTLVSAALMAAVLTATGGFLYLRLRADLMDAVDAGLRSRADALLGSQRIAPGELGEPGHLAEPDDAFVQVLGPDGEVLASSAGLGTSPLLTPDGVVGLQRPRITEQVVQTVEEPVPARVLAVPAPGGRVLLVGSSLDDQNEALTRLAILLAVGGPLALVLATGVGWAVAGAALRPVERMRAEAAAISASEPGRRLPEPQTGDELARLGETLNGMLDRMEEALQRERRFVAEASHELRTPLATLRTELELALRRSRSAEELEGALRSAAEESDRLARLAEDLLVMARADRGRLRVRREPVELAPLIAGAIEAYSTRATTLGVSIEASVPEGLRGRIDALRFRQVIGNLLDNALRHTRSGGRVTIDVARASDSLRFQVRDTGEGFPASFLPRAFEPFARPDGPRSRPDGGAGLGLAIVRAVAEAHGGSVEAENSPEGGASVTVRIPE
ncbi:MAG: sensor histidine kinase [Actinomycetota bacterium]